MPFLLTANSVNKFILAQLSLVDFALLEYLWLVDWTFACLSQDTVESTQVEQEDQS